MTKDIYKWWSRKKLKGEILKLKLTYNELFDAMLKTQEENKKLRKAYNICDEANIDLKEKIKDLRKTLNERSYVTLEEKLTKAKEIIKDYLTIVKGSHTTVCGVPEENRTIYVLKLNKEAEQFLNEVEKPIESSVDYIIEQNEKEVV